MPRRVAKFRDMPHGRYSTCALFSVPQSYEASDQGFEHPWGNLRALAAREILMTALTRARRDAVVFAQR